MIVFTVNEEDMKRYELPVFEAVKNATRELGRMAAKEKDELISSRITSLLGHDSWTPQGIANRVRRLIPHDREYEVWTLDGEPMIEIYPLNLETVDGENGSHIARATIPYRIL